VQIRHVATGHVGHLHPAEPGDDVPHEHGPVPHRSRRLPLGVDVLGKKARDQLSHRWRQPFDLEHLERVAPDLHTGQVLQRLPTGHVACERAVSTEHHATAAAADVVVEQIRANARRRHAETEAAQLIVPDHLAGRTGPHALYDALRELHASSCSHAAPGHSGVTVGMRIASYQVANRKSLEGTQIDYFSGIWRSPTQFGVTRRSVPCNTENRSVGGSIPPWATMK